MSFCFSDVLRPSAHRRLLLPLIACLAVACSDGGVEVSSVTEIQELSHATGVRVLLLGIDGATFDVMQPLLDAGELPNFQRLIENGTHGTLRSIRPMRSPAIWTTIATGHLRDRHGVRDFRNDDNELVSSRDRRTLALWNLTSALERTTGFVGWWVTWPAEPVLGYMISDRMSRSRWTEWTGAVSDSAKTYPPELEAEVGGLACDPSDPPMEDFDALFDWTEDERNDFLAFDRPLYGHGFSAMKFAHCTQRTYEEIALHQLRSQTQPDLLGLFWIANDTMSHTFWHHFEPDRFEDLDPDQTERLAQSVPNYYRHNDQVLGRVLELVGDDTVVMVVSDHGFQASGVTPRERTSDEIEELRDRLVNQVAVGQSGQHNEDGILIASGGPIRKGARASGRIQDVAPTVLALLGLPMGADMEGRVMKDLFEPDFLERFPPRRIATYEGVVERPEAAEGEVDDEELRQRLKALGYLN